MMIYIFITFSLIITCFFIIGTILSIIQRNLKIFHIEIKNTNGLELAQAFLELKFIIPAKVCQRFNEALFLLSEAERSNFLDAVKHSKNIYILDPKVLLHFKDNNDFIIKLIEKNLNESNYKNIKEISNHFLSSVQKDKKSWVHFLKDNQVIIADFNHLNLEINIFKQITHKNLKKELHSFVSTKIGNLEIINLSFIQVLENLFDFNKIDQNILENMIIKNKKNVKPFHVSNFICNLSNFKDFKFLSPKSQLLIIKEILFPLNIEDIPSYALYSFLLNENTTKILEEISFWQDSLSDSDKNKIKEINFSHIKEIYDVLLSYSLNKDLESLMSTSLDQKEILYLEGKYVSNLFSTYQVVIPKSSSDINKIGQQMQNCIGNLRYEYFIKAKRSFIAFLIDENNNYKFCVEIEDILGQHRIKEIKAIKNERASYLLEKKIQALLKK